MRKLFAGLVLVIAFATGLAFGLGTPRATAGTKCWTVCNGGTAMECCRSGAIVLCRVLADGC